MTKSPVQLRRRSRVYAHVIVPADKLHEPARFSPACRNERGNGIARGVGRGDCEAVFTCVADCLHAFEGRARS